MSDGLRKDSRTGPIRATQSWDLCGGTRLVTIKRLHGCRKPVPNRALAQKQRRCASERAFKTAAQKENRITSPRLTMNTKPTGKSRLGYRVQLKHHCESILMFIMDESISRRGFLKSLGVAGAGAVMLKSNLAAAADSAAVSPDTSPNSPVNLLFDSWSVQVLDNRAASAYPPNFTPAPDMTQNGRRLAVILGALNSFGQTTHVDFKINYTNPTSPVNSSNPTITPALLSDTDVYISLTRNTPSGFAYQAIRAGCAASFR